MWLANLLPDAKTASSLTARTAKTSPRFSGVLTDTFHLTSAPRANRLSSMTFMGPSRDFRSRWKQNSTPKTLNCKKIFETGWRTARLCAGETYMDCPYYEQMQYLGDTRIQALSRITFRHRRWQIGEEFLNMADLSHEAEGLTESRYPAHVPQFIPGYSLIYICSPHDYMMYGGDNGFVKDKLFGDEPYSAIFQEIPERRRVPGKSALVEFHRLGGRSRMEHRHRAKRQRRMLRALWFATADGLSGCRRLGASFRHGTTGRFLRTDIARLKKAIQDKYWDAGRGLYADDSRHTNSLSTPTHWQLSPKWQREMRQIRLGRSSQQTNRWLLYRYISVLCAGSTHQSRIWRRLSVVARNMARESQTGTDPWAETSDIDGSRSDCHAWRYKS